MPVDPREQAVLDQLEAFHRPPLAKLQPFNARNLPTIADAVRAVHAKRLATGDDEGLSPIPEPMANIEHKLIPGAGRDILLRIYTPEGSGPFPVLVYFHGGGFVIANLNVYDASCRALAKHSGCMVVSVAYHQAPERQFPAAIDDAYSAFQWVKGHAAEIGGKADQVAVVGESAGGNLAAAVCLMARDKGEGAPSYQVLIYPMLNNAFDTPSYQAHGDAKPLNKDMMVWFWGHYLPTEKDAENAYACPLKADNLNGLPPATVITAEIDPLCSEGEQYADRLRQAGVSVKAKRYDGVTHEFFGMGAVVEKARLANHDVAFALRDAFGLATNEQRERPPAGRAERVTVTATSRPGPIAATPPPPESVTATAAPSEPIAAPAPNAAVTSPVERAPAAPTSARVEPTMSTTPAPRAEKVTPTTPRAEAEAARVEAAAARDKTVAPAPPGRTAAAAPADGATPAQTEIIVPADGPTVAPEAAVVAGTAPTVYEGMEVLSADGAQVGHIKEVTPETFLVDRKMHRDIYIPFAAIQGIKGDAVELTVAAGDVDHQDWQKPPLL